VYKVVGNLKLETNR